MAVTVTGYPSTTTFSFPTPDTLESKEVIQYVVVNNADFPNDEYIEVVYNSETITIYLQEECRYTPLEVSFINKEGAQQFISFYKAREDRLKTKSEDYESDYGQPINGFHQYVDYNKQGRTSFKINSGFVEEEMNDDFKQLLLSNRVWVYEDGYIPVNVKSSSLTYKNRQKDRLISYEIEFEYSYNDVNNI